MAEDEACPKCGAIYSRVEAYLKAEQARTTSSKPPGMVAQVSRFPSGRMNARLVDPDFVITMRNESLYPTFRSLVRITTWLIYLLAFITIFIAIFRVEGVAARISMMVGAITMAVIATAAKEAALMLADMSDATVIQAARARNDAIDN